MVFRWDLLSTPSVFSSLMFELVCILSGMTNRHTSKKYFLLGTMYCDCVDSENFQFAECLL